jgi:pimeloyl-ACP methyl ester carboxylesterase
MALYVRETGPVSAPTIVLVPGGGIGGWFWTPQIERLPEYHLLVPDMPEQGRSLSEGPFTVADGAERLAGLIRCRAHGGRAHLAGISLGAQTVVRVLATTPELVDHALVSSANVRGLPGARWLKPYFRTMMPFRAVPWLVRLGMRSSGVPMQFYEDVLREAQETTLDSLTHVTMASLDFRIPAGLDRVRCPVLVVAGDKEPGLMRASARELAAAIPGAQGRLVKKGIHAWNLQYPDLFTTVLRAWITDQPLPEGLIAWN